MIHRFEVYDQHFSLEVLIYIIDVTKCQILHALNKFEEIQKIFPIIESFEFEDEFKIATKSAFLGILNLIICSDNNKSLMFTEEAFKICPDNDFFIYRYAKLINIFKKQQYGYQQQPSITEEDMLKRLKSAFHKSKDAKMGLLLIKLLLDYRRIEEAEEICLNMFERKENLPHLSNLVAHLLRLKKSDEARQCLDLLSASIPQKSKYLHYEGQYYEQIGENEVNTFNK